MEETALLTDDEIVALCAADGRPWPLGLATVECTVAELSRAGMRGMRSLMVRRLAGSDADKPGVRPHQLIARDVSAFLDATERIGAYIAPADDPGVLGGASVTAARTPDGWVLDTATAAGVHALRTSTAAEAADAVLQLAEKTYRSELFADSEEASKWICVLRSGPESQHVLTLGPGTATGVVGGAQVDAWDADLVRGLFGADEPR